MCFYSLTCLASVFTISSSTLLQRVWNWSDNLENSEHMVVGKCCVVIKMFCSLGLGKYIWTTNLHMNYTVSMHIFIDETTTCLQMLVSFHNRGNNDKWFRAQLLKLRNLLSFWAQAGVWEIQIAIKCKIAPHCCPPPIIQQ